MAVTIFAAWAIVARLVDDADPQRVVFRGVEVSVPDDWTVVHFDGTETACVGSANGTAFVGDPPDSETCNLAYLDGPSVWLLDLQPSSERDDAPSIRVGDLDGRLWVDEHDRIGVAFVAEDVYVLVSRTAEDVLDSVRAVERAEESHSPTSGATAVTVSTTSVPSRDPATLDVVLSAYEVLPETASPAAGAYSFTVRNQDDVPHDLVLIATDLAADALPTTGIRVDEADLDVRARTARIDPNGVGTLTATLRAGSYVLVCTVPHHYVRDRMIATLTVTS